MKLMMLKYMYTVKWHSITVAQMPFPEYILKLDKNDNHVFNV